MADKRIARVFVRRTQYTPSDDLVFFEPPGMLVPEVDEVHISCLFTWDKPKAEMLAHFWKRVAPVRVGGPAYGNEGGGGDEFTPGLYIAEGNTFSSRGCVRKCKYCMVPCQEGSLRELNTIHSGSKLMDNNLLACSRSHIEKVFDMLETQKGVILSGGLDARLLEKWHAERIAKLNLRNIATAYDSMGVGKSVENALEILHEAGIPHGKIHCFVLGGFFDNDTPEKAEKRCRSVLLWGATATAMYYRGPDEMEKKWKSKEWQKWVTRWSNQRAIYSRAKRDGIPTYQDTLKCK